MAQNEAFEAQWDDFEYLHKRLRDNIQSLTNEKKKLLSTQTDDVKAAKKEIRRLHDDICKIFTYLKALHQKSLMRREKAQCELNNLCKNVDSESLHFKNFEYDQLDTLKQIAICNDYKSHDNEPKLVSKEEFYQKQSLTKFDDIHQEKTLRLQYELTQRKDLQSDLRDMTQKVKTLSTELHEKKRFLNNLQSKIGNVFEAIKPLQKYMNLPSCMLYPNEAEIDCLPARLFAIYQSFTTQIHCDNTLDEQIKIEIKKRLNFKSTRKSVLGKRKFSNNEDSFETKNNRKHEQNTNNSSTNLEDGEIGNHATQEPQRKKARRSSNGTKSKTKSSHCKKSRRRDNNTSNKSKTEKEKEHHSISTQLNQYIDSMLLSVEFQAIGIELEFMYCERYKLVLVAVKRQRNNGETQWNYEDGSIFMNLFDGHTMIQVPDELRKEQRVLENGCIVPYFCAFSWAQELSGCYIFSAKESKTQEREIVNLHSLQKALKERKENRVALQNQIKQLTDDNKQEIWMKNIMNKAFENEKEKQKNPINKLLSFKLISDKDKIKKENVNKYKTYFDLMLERKPFSLRCMIEVNASYPNHPPLFYVEDICSNENSDDHYLVNEAKNIEIKLNGDFNYVTNKNKHLLLSMMIHKLQMCFDVYVDTKVLESSNGSHEKQNVRIHRGRDRRPQY